MPEERNVEPWFLYHIDGDLLGSRDFTPLEKLILVAMSRAEYSLNMGEVENHVGIYPGEALKSLKEKGFVTEEKGFWERVYVTDEEEGIDG